MKIRIMFVEHRHNRGKHFPMEIVQEGNVVEESWRDADSKWQRNGFLTRSIVIDVPDGDIRAAFAEAVPA